MHFDADSAAVAKLQREEYVKFRKKYVKQVTGGLLYPVGWSKTAKFESYGPIGDKGYYPVRKLLSPVSSAQLKEWQASSHTLQPHVRSLPRKCHATPPLHGTSLAFVANCWRTGGDVHVCGVDCSTTCFDGWCCRLYDLQAARASQSLKCSTPFEALAQYDAVRHSFESGQQKHAPLCYACAVCCMLQDTG